MERYFKIISHPELLSQIGINYDIFEKIGKLHKIYPMDWYQLEIEYTIGGQLKFTGNFDLPKQFLEEI